MCDACYHMIFKLNHFNSFQVPVCIFTGIHFLNCIFGFKCIFFLLCAVCLQELLKYSKSCDGCDDLQEALTSILGILKAVNDSMHLIAITGYEVRNDLGLTCSCQIRFLQCF